MTVTRDDVARKAQVSSATVSYVINGGPRPVSAETRARVLAAIDELGYKPNVVARNLRLQRTFTIGLVIPDTHNPFFSEVLSGIEDAAFLAGYRVILLHSGYDPSKEEQFVDLLQSERVEGVIWIPATSNFTPVSHLAQLGIPTVVFDRVSPESELVSLMTDNYQGGYLATDHLAGLGHRRIGYISRPVELSHSKGRLQGYKAALSDHGLEFDPALVVRGGFRLEDGKKALFSLLSLANPPTGLFTFNDMMAIGALRGAAERGVSVPGDLSIVGFDDIDQSSYTCPALTTIHVDKLEMGRRGTALLLNLINNIPSDLNLLEPITVSLTVRESTTQVSGLRPIAA